MTGGGGRLYVMLAAAVFSDHVVAVVSGNVAVFSGHVLDKTTGQPLPGVRVAFGAAHAITDKAGRFALHGVRAGTATITLESNDVPFQRVTVTISAPATARDLRACSTTLDYNCGAPAAPADTSGGSG